MSRILAVIGTAGRDRSKVMDAALWKVMCDDLRSRLRPSDVLVSGGAAWADHLAVHGFLSGWCAGLKLFLPAPLVQVQGAWQFEEVGSKSSGSAANWYHHRFSAAVGVDTLGQLVTAMARGAVAEAEPARAGFSGMFARNKKVAANGSSVLAYTFNDGNVPADGGTLDTWKQVSSPDRVHVDLAALQVRVRQAAAPSVPLRRSERYR